MATSKEKAMVIKLDLTKAYDWVSWNILGHVLLALGFDMEWVDWILNCVTSPSFSVIINGEPTDLFLASRGLQQGDPISPYLFIIMAEGLGRFTNSQADLGLV